MKQLSETSGLWMRRKLTIVVTGVFFLCVILLIVKLYNIAVVKSEYYQAKANRQQLDTFEINANRGTIYDRNGKILATSTPVWDVIMSPYDILYTDECHKAHTDSCAEACPKDECANCIGKGCKLRSERICGMLSEVLEIDYEKLIKICESPDSRYEIIKKKISKQKYDELTKIKADKGIGIYSVYLVENSQRSYPHDKLASTLIGFTSDENVGQYGVEAYYEKYLQGRDGKLQFLKDGVGRTASSEHQRHFEAQNGNNLHMTIDVVLQSYLEKNLEIIATQHNVGNRATGIMMNPNTGEILAMATTMGYNLNDHTALDEKDALELEQFKTETVQKVISENPGFTGVCEKGEPCPVVFEVNEEEGEEDPRCSQCKLQQQINSEVSNKQAKLWEDQWRNKAITELYYPGSVFKTITAAAALEEKKVSLHSSFFCSGERTIGDTQIHCWQSWGHGSVNSLQDALTASCNPSFIDISANMGVDKFYDYLEAFGITEKTGIDLPAESSPIVVPRDKMTKLDLATSSFGQTNKITPLQMITAFATCVNGGYLVTPHVVDKITDNDGNVIKTNGSGVKRQILSQETSEYMRQLLEGVVEANGGSNAYISGYKIGGKSGTSQKLDEYPEDERMRYVASFCAFSPADNPKVIMLVIVDEPNPGGSPYYGSMVAAPVVSAVFKESFQYLEIYPMYTEEEQAEQDTVVPYVIGKSPIDAEMPINAAGLDADTVGSGGLVIRTVPPPGSPLRKGSTVILYTDESDVQQAVVPDVYGMTVTEANEAIAAVGLNIRPMGGSVSNANAVAVYMSIDPGTTLSQGSVVDVQFAVNQGHGG